MSTTGLSLPTLMGVGHTQEEDIHETWSTFDEMELQLARQGIEPVMQPECEVPRITARLLTDVDNREFSQIFANFGEWYGYVTNLYGRIQAKIVEIDNELHDLEVQNRKYMLDTWRASGGDKKDKPTIQEMSDFNDLHPRVRELKHEWQQWEQQRLILSPRKDQLYRDMKIISRQVEIRGQELERNRMGGNMPSRQHISRGQR
jgi:hypothetical protein